jgi:type III secretory pathway component EscU
MNGRNSIVFITAEYLMNLTDDFSRWNSYIFFLAAGQLDRPLKYAIENNKFSTRKIVIENAKNPIDATLINQVLSEHIINDNINFEVTKKVVKEFRKDGDIAKSLEIISSDIKEMNKEENLLKVLNHLESLISNEN